jgi:hypothetical protein
MEIEDPKTLHPDFAAVHEVLTHHLLALDPRATDDPFSDHIIAHLLPLLGGLEPERFAHHFQDFIDRHRSVLERIYSNHDFTLSEGYDPTHAWRVLHTPAALLTWERALNGNPFALAAQWYSEVYEGEFLLNDLLLEVGLTT